MDREKIADIETIILDEIHYLEMKSVEPYGKKS